MKNEISLVEFEKLDIVSEKSKRRSRLSLREKRRKLYEYKRKRDEMSRSRNEVFVMSILDYCNVNSKEEKISRKEKEKFLDRVVMRCVKKKIDVYLVKKRFEKVIRNKEIDICRKSYYISEYVYSRVEIENDKLNL